ncbi:kelch-like protein 6 [Tetranychus urticae]|uniref:kelch-like protein 6 n=1 Tax=Tetranychus urticae TaxID=32264 RepID=UPI00077BF026|nr:kelch-like protein 6 [Tetranychus urticae]
MAEDHENGADDLKIVNRNREYYVSKKLICSSVPYFEKMFCCDLLESKENKVEMDFDERVFDAILDWIHSGSFFIKMNYVIRFYDATDYLMINESLLKPFLSYFYENFTIKHLPVILPQVTKVSKLLSSGTLDSIICRRFLLIANTDIFLNYPLETVETILRLDLMVYSEYQIFESILQWVYEDDSREKWFPQLLSCVRWSFMDPVAISKIKNNELIKTLSNFDTFIETNRDCGFNRSNQSFFVSIHRVGNTLLRLKVLDNELFCFSVGEFTQDDSMSLEFVHGENTSDILFDSGTKGIRIDWVKKTYRWINFKAANKTYHSKLRNFIVEVWFKRNSCYLEDKDAKLSFPLYSEDYLLLESNGKFIVIGKTKGTKKWFGMFPVTHPSWFNYEDHAHSFKATVLDDVVYILTKDLEFIQFNYETRSFYKSEPFKGKKWNFNNLILTSHQTKDNKVILVNKSSGKVRYFCINQKKWIGKYRILNVNFCSNNSHVYVDMLIAFTSTFLPIKDIKPLYRQCFY